MNVRTILETKGRRTYTERPEADLAAAVALLARHKIGALVIVDAAGHVAGILSERDIIRAIAEGGAERLQAPISSAMTTAVATCHEADTVDGLMATMTDLRVRHLPVVDGRRLVGMVSIGDVVKNRIEEIEHEAESMRSYIAMA